MTRRTDFVLVPRKDLAAVFGVYRSLSITFPIFWEVSVLILLAPFKYLDTVLIETSASRATSRIVARLVLLSFLIVISIKSNPLVAQTFK